MALSGLALAEAAIEMWQDYEFRLFPCKSDKRPLTPHGFYDASSDPETIRRLFQQFGEEATMVGCAMGDGVFAVDLDLYKNADLIEELEQQGVNFNLDTTRVHRTRRGGLHILYSSRKEIGCPQPYDGVEIKGKGGYIIFPPSRGYEVLSSVNVSAAPDAVVKWIEREREVTRKSTDEQLIERIVQARDFHTTIATLASRWYKRGHTRAQVMTKITEALQASVASNSAHNRHDRWQDMALDRNGELSRIVNSGYAKYSTDRGSELMREAFAQKGSKSASDVNASRETEEDPSVSDAFPRSYEALAVSTLDQDRGFVVHPLIMQGDVVLLSADPKAGKTLFAVGLGLSMAAGLRFGDLVPMNHEGQQSPLPVLYFAFEGQGAVRLRIQAWLKEKEKEFEIDRSLLRMTVVEYVYDLTNPAHQQTIINGVHKMNLSLAKEGLPEVQLIVIDTLTKAMPGKNQNTVEDTSAVFAFSSALKSAGINSALLLIHHNNKMGQVRGSTNILAEPDTVLQLHKNKELEEVDGKLTHTASLTVAMARAIDDTFAQTYKFEDVDLGLNKQGVTMRAPIFAPVLRTSDRRTIEQHQLYQTTAQNRATFYNWLSQQLTEGVAIQLLELDTMLGGAPAPARNFYFGVKLKHTKQLEAWQQIAMECTLEGLKMKVDAAAQTLTMSFETLSMAIDDVAPSEKDVAQFSATPSMSAVERRKLRSTRRKSGSAPQS